MVRLAFVGLVLSAYMAPLLVLDAHRVMRSKLSSITSRVGEEDQLVREAGETRPDMLLSGDVVLTENHAIGSHKPSGDDPEPHVGAFNDQKNIEDAKFRKEEAMDKTKEDYRRQSKWIFDPPLPDVLKKGAFGEGQPPKLGELDSALQLDEGAVTTEEGTMQLVGQDEQRMRDHDVASSSTTIGERTGALVRPDGTPTEASAPNNIRPARDISARDVDGDWTVTVFDKESKKKRKKVLKLPSEGEEELPITEKYDEDGFGQVLDKIEKIQPPLIDKPKKENTDPATQFDKLFSDSDNHPDAKHWRGHGSFTPRLNEQDYEAAAGSGEPAWEKNAESTFDPKVGTSSFAVTKPLAGAAASSFGGLRSDEDALLEDEEDKTAGATAFQLSDHVPPLYNYPPPNSTTAASTNGEEEESSSSLLQRHQRLQYALDMQRARLQRFGRRADGSPGDKVNDVWRKLEKEKAKLPIQLSIGDKANAEGLTWNVIDVQEVGLGDKAKEFVTLYNKEAGPEGMVKRFPREELELKELDIKPDKTKESEEQKYFGLILQGPIEIQNLFGQAYVDIGECTDVRRWGKAGEPPRDMMQTFFRQAWIKRVMVNEKLSALARREDRRLKRDVVSRADLRAGARNIDTMVNMHLRYGGVSVALSAEMGWSKSKFPHTSYLIAYSRSEGRKIDALGWTVEDTVNNDLTKKASTGCTHFVNRIRYGAALIAEVHAKWNDKYYEAQKGKKSSDKPPPTITLSGLLKKHLMANPKAQDPQVKKMVEKYVEVEISDFKTKGFKEEPKPPESVAELLKLLEKIEKEDSEIVSYHLEPLWPKHAYVPGGIFSPFHPTSQ